MVNSNEKFIIARSYVVTFYTDVVNLTSMFGDYKSIMFEIDSQSTIDEEKKMMKNEIEPQLRQVLLNSINILRQLIEKTYIYYVTIVSNAQQFVKSEQLVEAYNKMSSKNIINMKDLYDYILELNMFIANDIVESFVNQANMIDNTSNYQQ